MCVRVTLGFEQWKASVSDQTILLAAYSEIGVEETLDPVAQTLWQPSSGDITITHHGKSS